MRIIVLGAGILGTATAWFLNRAGHEVTVLDRRSDAALETTYGNAAQISVSQAEPWAGPGVPLKVMRWWFSDESPLLFRPRMDLQQWLWGAQFTRECWPGRGRRNLAQMIDLAKYSLAALREVRAETGIAYDHLSRGIMQIFFDRASFDTAGKLAGFYQQYGVRRESKTVAEAVAIEPALATVAPQLAGAIYGPGDETGDSRMFTQGLAALCAARGVSFRYGIDVEHLVTDGARITGVQVSTGSTGSTSITGSGATIGSSATFGGTGSRGNRRESRSWAETLGADAYVVALGSYSARLLRPVGVPALIYPAKGYSATLPITDPAKVPNMSVTDQSAKIAFTRLGNRLRIAGTAELNGYNTDLNMVRCAALMRRAQAFFPDSCDWSAVEYWTGLRPSTPSNVPLIGPTRYPNLYLNTGHGTLGWTMGPGSGKALAALIDGCEPAVNFSFLKGA